MHSKNRPGIPRRQRCRTRIKELRKQKHLKVEDVSRFMGFESEQAVYKWQRGDSLPTVDNLYALSKLFETTVDDILRGEREEDEGPLSFLVETIDMLGYNKENLTEKFE